MCDVVQESSGAVATTGRVRRIFGNSRRVFVTARREFGAPFALLISGVLLQRLAALFPEATERLYARAVYTHLIAPLSWFGRRFSFSLGELLTYVLIVAGLLYLLNICVRLYTQPCERARRVIASLRFTLWSAGVLLWAFMFAFGLNYQRPLLFNQLGYEQRRASATELGTIGRLIVSRINETHGAARAGGRQVPGAEELRLLLEESYEEAASTLTTLPRGTYAPPKPLYSSELMTRLGLGGVYFPFTGEPNYNADVPDFQLPFIIAHEMAHQRGVARESEANFVAYIVCVNSADPFVQYSGYRNGLGVVSELYRLDPAKARELFSQLGVGYREDSRRAAAFWAKAAGAAGALSQRVNDLYLRANRVKSGTADYSASTTLIIGYYLHKTARETRVGEN